jgi:hypothetical protein
MENIKKGVRTYPILAGVLYLIFGLQMPGIANDWKLTKIKKENQTSLSSTKNKNDGFTTVTDDNSSISFKVFCNKGKAIINRENEKVIVNCKK